MAFSSVLKSSSSLRSASSRKSPYSAARRQPEGVVYDAPKVTPRFVRSKEISSLACAVYRIHEGGSGTAPDLLAILTSLLLGLAWRRWRGRSLDKTSFGELYGLGLLIHLCAVAAISALLPESRAAFLQQIAPFALLVYPLIFAILGLLMRHRYRLETERAKLEKSRESYRSLFANNHLPMFLIDPADSPRVSTRGSGRLSDPVKSGKGSSATCGRTAASFGNTP